MKRPTERLAEQLRIPHKQLLDALGASRTLVESRPPRACCPYGGHSAYDRCRHADGRPVRWSERHEIRALYPLE